MLIIPALALVLAFSLILIAVIRPPTRTAALLSLYLLSYANIVMVGQITNSFYRLNSPWFWLALHLILAVIAWLLWLRMDRPALSAPWLDGEGRFLPRGWARSGKRWPELWLLGIGVAAVFLFSAVLIWVVPPNTNDSLATHMTRIAYWLQRGAFFPWSSQRIWQISYPVNMQLQMFWTILFLRNDRIVEVVQWFGALAALVSVYGLASLMGAARPQALFAACVWATFPEIILESSTTQNDLVAGTLFAVMLYLLFLGLSTRSTKALALSGLALGLGLGTKQTLAFLLPGLALVLVLALLYCGKASLRALITWGAASAAAFLILGAYMFVVNQVNFGHPMGPETAVNSQTAGLTSQSLMANLVYNTFRLSYQSIDPTGLPDPLAGYGVKLKALVVGKVVNALRFPVESSIAVATNQQFSLRTRYILQEDVAWYGPLFAALVVPMMFYQFWKGLKRKELVRVSLFILAVTFLLCDATFRPGWDPAQGRYFIPAVTITAPLLAFYIRPGRGWVVFRWLVVALALTIAVETFLTGQGKPLSGEYNVWQTSRVQQETVQAFYMRKVVTMVDEKVPADATLGLINYGMYLEYPFFRENFSRRLVQIYPADEVHDLDWLKAQGIEYILVQATSKDPPVNMPAEFRPVANVEEWTLFAWAKK